MKKFTVVFMSLLAMVLMSCSNASKLESEAKDAVSNTFREFANDPGSVKISDIETAFCNDSLCILHLNFTGKNGLGIETTNKMEYVYMASFGKKYEAYHELGSDSLYLTSEAYETEKIGKIYEDLPYETALYYRVAVFINNQGRLVSDKLNNQEVKVPVPTGTGAWEIHNFKNEFGEDVGEKFLTLMGKGVFSNSATTNSKLSVIMIVTQNGVFFRFAEYGTNLMKNEKYFNLRIKDSKNVISEIRMYNDEDGNIRNVTWKDYSLSELSRFVDEGRTMPDGNKILKDLLEKESVIAGYAEVGEYTMSKYTFKLDLTGYNKAYNYLMRE